MVARFAPWLDPARIGAFDIRAYLISYATMMIPNVAFGCALLFAIAVLTRNSLATYAGSIVLYVLYFISAALTNSPLMAASRPGAGGGAGAALFDPFGLSAFFEVTRFWSAAAKNVDLVGAQPLFVVNRVLWLGVSEGIAIVVARMFSFRQRSAAPSKTKVIARRDRSRSNSALWSATSLHLRILKSKPFLALLLLWLGLAASEIFSDLLNGEYGAALYPSTGIIIETLRMPLSLIGTILLIFYGSELYWREQRDRIAPIINATPTSPIVLLSAKAIALATIVVTLVFTGILPGIAIQLLRGPQHFNALAYLSFFVSGGGPLVLFAVAVLFLNALSPGKYAGMVFSLLFVILTSRPQMIGLNHPLFRYGWTPPLRFSEVAGFGYDVPPFAAMLLHWTLVAALLFLLTAMKAARIRKVLLIGVALLVVASTAWLYTRIDNEDVLDWRAQYEKKYRALASLPRPRITAVTTNVDLYDRRVHVAGTYELTNESSAPIARVLVALRRDATNVQFAIPNATLRRDEQFGMADFILARPLQPGERTHLRYDATFVRDVFDFDADDSIEPNGSFLLNIRVLPTLGYRWMYQIQDPRERNKRGLGPAVELIEGDVTADADDVRFAATISTPRDQTAIAPGRIVRTWTNGGRRFTEFRADRTIRNIFAIASARYDVLRKTHRGIALEMHYEPSHKVNAARMLDVAAQTLDYADAEFGPYGAAQLRMAEVPSYADFGALAMPNSVFFTEHRSFLIDVRNPNRLDLLGRRVAHEVAHQWWGFIVAPASAPGSTFIVESLTKYTELMVLERLHGRDHVRRLLDVERDRYLAGRAGDENPEVPLLRVGNQSHLYYAKGAMVLYAIRDLIGETQLNAALRAFVAEQSSRHGLTRATDLLPHLRRVANDEQYALMMQWLNDIVLYDLSVASMTSRQRADGRWDVVAHVRAVKTHVDGAGNESPLPMRESIDLRAVDAAGETIIEQKHVLHDGDNAVTLIVDRQPAEVIVDPWMLRINKRSSSL